MAVTVTPLCHHFSQLSVSSQPRGTTRRNKSPSQRASYNSPQLFSSALRPLCPDRSQTDVRHICAIPARYSRDIARLRVSRFRLAPTSPPTTLLDFADIEQSEVTNNTSSSEDEANKNRVLIDPKFLKALAKHQFKKVMRLRRHPKLRKLLVRVPHLLQNNHIKHKSGWKPPRPSTPFNEDTDLDPFMLFPERQWPYSALKDNSIRYNEEAKAALEAKEMRYRARRGSMTTDDWKEMIHITYGLGKFKTPGQQSISCEAGSPMDIDV